MSLKWRNVHRTGVCMSKKETKIRVLEKFGFLFQVSSLKLAEAVHVYEGTFSVYSISFCCQETDNILLKETECQSQEGKLNFGCGGSWTWSSEEQLLLGTFHHFHLFKTFVPRFVLLQGHSEDCSLACLENKIRRDCSNDPFLVYMFISSEQNHRKFSPLFCSQCFTTEVYVQYIKAWIMTTVRSALNISFSLAIIYQILISTSFQCLLSSHLSHGL